MTALDVVGSKFGGIALFKMCKGPTCAATFFISLAS